MDGTPPSTWIQRTRRVVALIEDGLLATLLTLMIAVATAQIVMRNLWDSGLVWGDPFTKVLVLWVALLGAMVAARYNNHIHIDVLSRFLPDKGKAGIQVVSALFTALVCGLVAYHATQLVLLDKEAATSAFGIVPIWISELIIPFGFAIIGLRYLFLSFGGIAALVRGQT